MKKSLRFLLRLSLLAVFLASCAPAAATATPEPLAASVIAPTATALPPTETLPADPTETLAPTPFPIATSRGPHLEATDPATVKLASGGLQLVEFFEFW